MKNKSLFPFIGLFFVFIIIVLSINNTNQTFKCLIWNNNSYYITYEPINDKDIGHYLGEVKKQINIYRMPKNDAESNYLKAGTKIFTIGKNNNLNEIAVKIEENNMWVYYKAYIVLKD